MTISIEDWQKYKKWRIGWAVIIGLIFGIPLLVDASLTCSGLDTTYAILAIIMGLIALPDWGRRVAPSLILLLLGVQKIISGYKLHLESHTNFSLLLDMELFIIGPGLAIVGIIYGVRDFLCWRRELDH